MHYIIVTSKELEFYLYSPPDAFYLDVFTDVFQRFLGTYITVCCSDFAASISYEQVYTIMSPVCPIASWKLPNIC